MWIPEDGGGGPRIGAGRCWLFRDIVSSQLEENLGSRPRAPELWWEGLLTHLPQVHVGGTGVQRGGITNGPSCHQLLSVGIRRRTPAFSWVCLNLKYPCVPSQKVGTR